MMIKQTDRMFTQARWRVALLLSAMSMALTSCIDEDLSDCGSSNAIEYRLELSTSLRMSLDEELTTPAEKQLCAALKTALADIITDRAKTMDLSFFNYSGGSVAKHIAVQPDANSLSLTVYMDRGDYHNIALAATQDINQVNISGASAYKDISLRQADGDTLNAHSAGIYRGYCRMAIDNESGHFYVPLYMQNSIPVLVVNPATSPAKMLAAYTRCTASGMMCADSTFVFDHQAVMRTLRTEGGGLTAFHTVCFPSADTPVSRATGDNPTEAEGGIWEMDLYTQLPDGKYVKNTIYIKEPLRAGEMEIIKVKLTDDGRVVSDNPAVGVSVKLDWKPGGDFDVEI